MDESNKSLESISIAREQELKERLDSIGLFGLRINDIKDKPDVQLDVGLDEYIDYLSRKNVDTVFYRYQYYDIEDYTIDKEMIKEDVCCEEQREELYLRIELHNEKMQALDYENPQKLFLMANVDGKMVSMHLKNPWLDEMEIEESYDEIYLQYLEELAGKKREYEREYKKSVYEYLLKDEKFALCTNQSLRRDYADTLWVKHHNLFAEHLSKGILECTNYKLRNMVETAWKLIKQQYSAEAAVELL